MTTEGNLQKHCTMPRPVGGDECGDINTCRQDIPGLFGIFAQTGKLWLSVKPRPVSGELHLSP